MNDQKNQQEEKITTLRNGHLSRIPSQVLTLMKSVPII